MTPLQQQTIEAAEIADALGYSKNYFLRIVDKLTNSHGMPPRLPSRNRWSRPAIEHWLKSYSTDTRPQVRMAPHFTAANFGTIEAQRAQLAVAYAGARA